MPRLFYLLCTLLALTSCDAFKEPVIKLYAFECGKIVAKDVSVFSPGHDEGVEKHLVAGCYLIKHKNGILLWDVGLDDSIGKEGMEVFDGAFHIRVEEPFLEQLENIGIKPGDITYLGLSHFHFDHVGNANAFKNAILITQEEEYAAAFGGKPESFGFDLSTYGDLAASSVIRITGDYDVFGDGRVVIKRAIGHTPGHQVLFVNLPETGPILLSGDLYHFTKNRTHSRIPSFNFNKEESIKSMENIEHFIKQTGATLWIQHDAEQHATIKHAPNYYK